MWTETLSNEQQYNVANAHGYLTKYADAPTLSYSLAGRLVVSKSGWGLLEVPNAVVRGLFDALHEPGIELPLKDGQLNAHISVFRKEDMDKIGGPDKLTERGHAFHYTLGAMKTVAPAGWPEISKVWYVEVKSPELEKLRKSYGLSALPKDGKHKFHITVAVRPKHAFKEDKQANSDYGVNDHAISFLPESTETDLEPSIVPPVKSVHDAPTEEPPVAAQGPTLPYSGKEAADKEAGILSAIPGTGLIAKPIEWGLNRFLRREGGGNEAYYANMAHHGLKSGLEGTGETLLPRTGGLALKALGPSTGVLDWVVANGLGQEMRHGIESAKTEGHPMLQRALQNYEPKVEHLQSYLAPGSQAARQTGIPISKNNFRRLRKFVGSRVQNPLLRNVLTSNSPVVDAAAAHYVKDFSSPTSPLLRNLRNAVEGPKPSPAADFVLKNFVGQKPPQNAPGMLLGEAALEGAGHALTGDWLGAAEHAGSTLLNPLNLAEAGMVRNAEKGRTGALMGLKMRMINNMANPKPGVLPAAERLGQRALSLIDPVTDEFTRVGKDLGKARVHANVGTWGANKVNPVAGQVADVGRANLQKGYDAANQLGSLKSIVTGAVHDVAPDVAKAREVASQAARAAAQKAAPVVAPVAQAAQKVTAHPVSRIREEMQKRLGTNTFGGLWNKLRGKIAAAHDPSYDPLTGKWELEAQAEEKVLAKLGTFHGARAGTAYKGDSKISVCPHCDQELTPERTYKDAKGWIFCRPCFRKGKGAIKTGSALGRLLWGLGGAAAGAAAGKLLHTGYKQVGPSLTELGRQMWLNPETNKKFLDNMEQPQIDALRAEAASSPRAFRSKLHKDPELQRATFASNRPEMVGDFRPGDVLVNSRDPANLHSLTLHTGALGEHAAIHGHGGQAMDLDLLHHATKPNVPFQAPFTTGSTHPDWVNIALRSNVANPTTLSQAMDQIAKRKFQMSNSRMVDAAVKEIVPELGPGAATGLLQSARGETFRNIARRFLPRDIYGATLRTIRGGCQPGETCSTFVGHALGQAGHPIMPGQTPGDFLRATGPGREFRVQDINIPQHQLDQGLLSKQNWRRWSPLAARAVPAAALAGLGAYGLYRALRPAPKKEEEKQAGLLDAARLFGGTALGGLAGRRFGTKGSLLGAAAGATAGTLANIMYPDVDRSKLKTVADQPAERQSLLKSKFQQIADRLKAQGVYANTYHKRISVPKTELSEQDLADYGFMPSNAAVPESGQDKWTTFRHPEDLHHFHSHDDHWTVHKDEHPSMAMVRFQNLTPLQRLGATVSGVKHVTTEGIPGSFAYLYNRLTRDRDQQGSPMLNAIHKEMAGKVAADGSLGSGADQGQSATQPNRLMTASGMELAGGENQAASDVSDPYTKDPDPNEFDVDLVKGAVDDAIDGTAETEVPSDIDTQTTGRAVAGYPVYQDSSAIGAQGRTQAGSGQGQDRSYASAGFSAPLVQDNNSLDQQSSGTPVMGPLPHLAM